MTLLRLYHLECDGIDEHGCREVNVLATPHYDLDRAIRYAEGYGWTSPEYDQQLCPACTAAYAEDVSRETTRG